MAASRKRRALICLPRRGAHPFVPLHQATRPAMGLEKDIIHHLSLQPIEAIGCGGVRTAPTSIATDKTGQWAGACSGTDC